jgi:hypothetical protein
VSQRPAAATVRARCAAADLRATLRCMPASLKPDPNWTKWVEWLGKEAKPGTISRDVFGMLAARQIWESFQEIVRVAPEEARKYGTFHTWFNASYLQAQGLAVRRQVEVADDVVSLGRLLDRIAKSPSVISRARYLAQHDADYQRLENEFFDELAGPGATAIDASVPLGELARLQSETANVRTWVTKEVAHYDPKTGEFGEGVTYGDVHRAIDLIFETYQHYCQLLLGTTVLGSVTMPPWEAAFKVPWILDDDAFSRIRQAAQEKEHRRLGAT